MGVGGGKVAAAVDGDSAVVAFGVAGLLDGIVLDGAVAAEDLDAAAAGAGEVIVFDNVAEAAEGGLIDGKA